MAQCRIAEVKENSPAATARLRVGDVVLSIGGRKVADVDGLISQIHRRRPKDKVTLEVRRGEDVLKRTVVLGRKHDA